MSNGKFNGVEAKKEYINRRARMLQALSDYDFSKKNYDDGYQNYYELAEAELECGFIDRDLLAFAKMRAENDQSRAKAIYINNRARILMENQ
ncbi:hypothetical protein CFI10_12485 [Marinobacterium iners]|uniref:hypothetical protein n=1 Tax=Marinobacterium iners TaxID=48076 RepID=UPI001A9072DE|nr:hypothetical protein [Marinobacterium iners]QSR35805.1 hypothetical protein CFI10_12485 [Marinobacterium iners]